MTGEKKSSDLASRLSVKRGGKLISKTLGKSSSPPSISAPPKAAVVASTAKKDEVQRHKNSFHDMLRRSPIEGHVVSLDVPASGVMQTPHNHGARSCSHAATKSLVTTSGRRSSEQQKSQHDKIAELEKLLAAAQSETAALRHELNRVKQDAQASVEVSRYQVQHNVPSGDAEMQTEPSGDGPAGTALNKSVEQERERHADHIAQNNDLCHRLAELQDQLLLTSSQESEPQHRDLNWNALTLRLHEAEKESHARLQQLLSLKSSISSLTRKDSQVSDAELAETLSQLANRVREWVVSNYRRSKISFDSLPEASVTVLRAIKTDYPSIDGADKLPLYQAIVSRMLARVFNEPLVVGMPDEGVFTGLRAFAERIQHGGVELRNWNRATLQVVEKCVPEAEIRSWRSDRLKLLASELEYVMASISSTQIASTARTALLGILNATAELQRTICLQKAEYKLEFFDAPHERHHHAFDDQAMEPVNDLEESMDDSNEPYAQREFAFCVFPSLQKAENDIVNIILRARVCCGGG